MRTARRTRLHLRDSRCRATARRGSRAALEVFAGAAPIRARRLRIGLGAGPRRASHGGRRIDGRRVQRHLADATGGGSPRATSQIAFPEDVCDAVYATDGYAPSVQNLAQTSLESDMVFSDGADQQLPAVSGDAAGGYAIALSVPV